MDVKGGSSLSTIVPLKVSYSASPLTGSFGIWNIDSMSHRMIDDIAIELPQELVDIIVDYLSQDKQALLSLLNASRIFRGRVRTHLFRSVDVCVDYSFSRQSQYALSTRSELLLSLVSSTAAIGDAVKELRCNITPVVVEPSLRFSSYWGHVRDIVIRLRCLAIIHLEAKTSLEGFTYVSGLTTALASATVSKIHVQRTFVAPRCLLHFLSAFPSLRALHLEDVFHNRPKTTIAKPSVPLPSIDELLVRKSTTFLEVLRTDECPIALAGLRRLVLLWFQEVNGRNDWGILGKTVGYASIQELYLQLTEFTRNLDHGVHGIARVPHLTIHLPKLSPFLSWLVDVLSSASKHYSRGTLKSFNLIIHWNQVLWDMNDIAALGVVLSLPHLQTLVKVRVILSHPPTTDPVPCMLLQETMKAVWNTLDEAGLKGRVQVESREVEVVDTYFEDL